MRVTMLGTVGAGKTTFMAGLHKSLFESNVRGFHIVPNHNSSIQAPDNFGELAKKEIIAGSFDRLSFEYLKGYPEKTSKTTVWQMELKHGNEKVVDFQWIDYRGGILMDSADENILLDEQRLKDINDLFYHLEYSQAVMLFVDAFKLTTAPSVANARTITNINTMTRFLIQYAGLKPNSDLTFLIVLSKVDAIDPKWHSKDFSDLLSLTNQAFEQFREVCLPNTNWSGGIVPITAVGEGNAKNQVIANDSENYFEREQSLNSIITNEPEPYNISHALFFCIGDLLRKQYLQERRLHTYTEKSLSEAVAKMQQEDPIAAWIKKNIASQPTSVDKVAELWKKNEAELKQLNRYDTVLRQLYDEATRKVTVVK